MGMGMSAPKLKVGLLGLGPSGQTHLKALTRVDAFELVAVADRDKARAAKFAAQAQCPAFDDYRQFLLQNSFDCLIVSEGLHQCLEHVRLAIRKKSHILKWAPMARDFAEATELASLAAAEQVRLDVADPLAYCGSFAQVRVRLSDKTQERPFLVRALWETAISSCQAAGHRTLGQAAWMTDRQSAGGGVLLYDGYGLIHILVGGLGLPQQVYCLTRSHASDKAMPYLAEDVAVLSLRFGEGLFAELVLIRHWDERPGCRQITVYAKEDKMTTECLSPLAHAAAPSGEDEGLSGCDDGDLSLRLLSDYAGSLCDPEGHPFGSDTRANLDVMAVIEAAYVSSQTGSPESPSRILTRPA
jgi:predicted dehydrogenase